MHHPNHKPAAVKDTDAGRIEDGGYRPPRSAVFPPVQVHNERDEEYYISRGYISERRDPAAFNRLGVTSPAMPATTEFPKYAADGSVIADPKALPPPDDMYPRWVGDEIACNEAEEREVCARTGIPFEGRTQKTTAASVMPPPAVARDEWEEFVAWKAMKAQPVAPKAPKRRRNLTGEQRKALGERLRAGKERAKLVRVGGV
jgi:hypothetical protein